MKKKKKKKQTVCSLKIELLLSENKLKYTIAVQKKKNWKRCFLLQMHRHQQNTTQIMKNLANISPSRKTNKALIIYPKEMEIYDMICLIKNSKQSS